MKNLKKCLGVMVFALVLVSTVAGVSTFTNSKVQGGNSNIVATDPPNGIVASTKVVNTDPPNGRVEEIVATDPPNGRIA